MGRVLSEPSKLLVKDVKHHCHVPATIVDQRPHHEGPKQAAQRVHGHSKRPEQRLEATVHRHSIPVEVGSVVKVLHVLKYGACLAQ